MTDDEDDWAPLTPAQLARRPGEDEAAAPTAVPAAARPLAPPPAPDPRAERALRELQERIARAGPASSLIAQVQHRAQRRERKRRAAEQATEQLLATVVVGEPRGETEPELEIDSRRSDLDPRELEPWFQELPAGERERLHGHWHGQRHKNDGVPKARRRRFGRVMAYGAGWFLLLGLCQSLLMGGFGLLPLLILAGAVAAFVAELVGGDRFSFAAAGGLAFVVVMGPMVFVQPLGLFSLMFATYGMCLLGMDGEMRRSAGISDNE